MQGVPSYYDQYFAADPCLEDAVWKEITRAHSIRVWQSTMDCGYSYTYNDENANNPTTATMNILIEDCRITPAKRVDYMPETAR